MMGFVVKDSGVLSSLQDKGRFGYAQLGLTSGGAADGEAYYWLNKILGNSDTAGCIEVALGGLKLEATVEQIICVTGANAPLSINGDRVPSWQSHLVKPGDMIELGFANQGVRCYLGVSGGFCATPHFGSVSTVVREGVGGLLDPTRPTLQNGKSLKKQDFLSTKTIKPQHKLYKLPEQYIPRYAKETEIRVIPSYQHNCFNRLDKRRFYSSQYEITKQWDRMGIRLSGPKILCNEIGLLSEGIALGAIQVPPDGQPIILMHDRQTLGGYPKIGTVFSSDISILAQSGQGTKMYFHPISVERAHNEMHLQLWLRDKIMLQRVG